MNGCDCVLLAALEDPLSDSVIIKVKENGRFMLNDCAVVDYGKLVPKEM